MAKRFKARTGLVYCKSRFISYWLREGRGRGGGSKRWLLVTSLKALKFTNEISKVLWEAVCEQSLATYHKVKRLTLKLRKTEGERERERGREQEIPRPSTPIWP